MKFRTIGMLAFFASVSISQATTISFEAESGDFKSGTTDTFSTGTELSVTYITTSQSGQTSATDSITTYHITIPHAGDYKLFMKVYAPDNNSDSLFLPSSANPGEVHPNQEINFLDGPWAADATPRYLWLDLANSFYEDINGPDTNPENGKKGYDVTNSPAIQSFTFAAGTQDFTIRGRESGFKIDQFRLESVPEPSSLTLLGLSGVILLLRRRK